MRTKKVLLISFFTILFWAFLHQASAATLVATSQLEAVPVMPDFPTPNLVLDCNDPAATLAQMRTEYIAGINHMKAYFSNVSAVSADWYVVLGPTSERTVNFPVGHFSAVQPSSVNIIASSKKMWDWLEDFNDQFSVFSKGYAKCAKNKNKKVQIEESMDRFFEMSSDALGVTVNLFEHAAREIKKWSTAWTALEGRDVLIEVDYFESVLNLSSNMKEAQQLVQENADLALAELDTITDEGTIHGRSSNNRAVQLFYR